jgi:polar amino acid transport system substrate-binding protein
VSVTHRRRRAALTAGAGLVFALLAAACSSSSSSSAPVASTSAPASSATSSSSTAAADLSLLTPGTLNLAADFTASPNQFISDGKNDGLDVALCQQLGSDMGLTVKWTNLTFDALIPGLQAKRYDGLCTAIFITKAREQVMNMVPYVRWGDTMAVKKADAAKYACSGSSSPCWSKFAGAKVATTSGGAEVTQLEDINKTLSTKMTILQFASNTQVYQAIANDSVDGVYVNDPQFAYFNRTTGDGGYQAVFTGVESNELALTTVKSNTALAEAFITALNKMEADGSYAKILKEWGVEGVSSFAMNPPASS